MTTIYLYIAIAAAILMVPAYILAKHFKNKEDRKWFKIFGTLSSLLTLTCPCGLFAALSTAHGWMENKPFISATVYSGLFLFVGATFINMRLIESEKDIRKVYWYLTAFAGYIGVTLVGSPFLQLVVKSIITSDYTVVGGLLLLLVIYILYEVVSRKMTKPDAPQM